MADLFGEVLDDAVLGHLGADSNASLKLLLDAGDHLLVFLRSEALHSYTANEDGKMSTSGGACTASS